MSGRLKGTGRWDVPSGGEEAVAALANHRPDLILMDIQLPIMIKSSN
jgi:CheY-like chemotaxis protein